MNGSSSVVQKVLYDQEVYVRIDGSSTSHDVQGRQITKFNNKDSDCESSFIAGMKDFALAIKEGHSSMLTRKEGKAVLHFCCPLQLYAKEGREVSREQNS